MSTRDEKPTNDNGDGMRLLLHACCGPCSMEPSRLLQERGIDPVIYYTNSNIHPEAEYARRLETLWQWAKSDDPQTPIQVVEGTYDRDAWESAVGRVGDAAIEKASRAIDGQEGRKDAQGDADASGQPGAYEEAVAGGASTEAAITLAVDPTLREARCRACYRLRFEESAQYAAAHGFTALGTTLSVSPYQYTQVIAEELQRAAEKYGLVALFEDYRPYYDEATRRSREQGMYRQNNCGCRISDLEAQAERAQRKAQRARAKAAEAASHADERAAEEAKLQARRDERRAYNEKQARKRAILKAMREQS